MIAHLQGKLVEKSPTQIIDCGGVGYHVNISLHVFFASQHRFYKVYTHLQIKRMRIHFWIYGKVEIFLDFYYRFLE
jgi:Holliday junction resolvasome RuvABC DNA-binding subunit